MRSHRWCSWFVVLGVFWSVCQVAFSQLLPVPPAAPRFSDVLLFAWSDPTVIWSNAHVVVRGVSTMGAASWAIAKYMPKEQDGHLQWNEAKGRWMVVLDGKEVADVTIEDAPSLRVGAWRCWIDEKSGEIEELPWRTVGGDQFRVKTDPPTSEGLMQFLLAKIDAKGVNVPAICRIESQYEVAHDSWSKKDGSLSLVSLYGWTKKDGHSRWLRIERWRDSQRMMVIEKILQKERVCLEVMWEYPSSNSPPSSIAAYDADRHLAMGWVDGKLFHVTTGETESRNPVYVTVDFNDKGCPREVRFIWGGVGKEMSWVADASRGMTMRKPVNGTGMGAGERLGIEKDVGTPRLWERFEQERMSFEQGGHKDGSSMDEVK